ncbi:MAG: DsbE family thiol:disulfide interchange protein, partial [Hyphomicrobiales bacterium]|nr:DsbE family thiol:disulfide interchange protein [Hyphomicrobiales bacterium]
MSDLAPTTPKRRWVLALPLLIFLALAALFWFRLGAGPAKLPSALIGR